MSRLVKNTEQKALQSHETWAVQEAAVGRCFRPEQIPCSQSQRVTSQRGMLAPECHCCDEPSCPTLQSTGILLSEEYGWRGRREGLKQEGSDTSNRTEQGDCLIINIGSRDMRRNIPDTPRQVNIGTECISLTRVKLKGNGGALSCSDTL